MNVKDYRHDDEKRTYIPSAGISGQGELPKAKKLVYAYDPHLPPRLRFDPNGKPDRYTELLELAQTRPLTEAEIKELQEGLRHQQPWLEWTTKQEKRRLEVDPVALHIHERVSTQAILRTALRQDIPKNLFNDPELEYREAVKFYQHEMGWANRMILGDSLQVMASLAQREALAGQVQMIYLDPPYGINFGSNFQNEIFNKEVKHGKDENLTREPEQIKAYRDTWSLGIHSYLGYLRDRLISCKNLLKDDGSIFVQISDENVHLVRNLLDEIFGSDNFMSVITFRTKIPLGTKYLANTHDYIIWYAKNKKGMKFRKILTNRNFGEDTQFNWIELVDGTRRKMTNEEKANTSLLPLGARPFRLTDLVSAGRTESCIFEFELEGKKFFPSGGKSWKTNKAGMEVLIRNRRVNGQSDMPSYVFFHDDYPAQELSNVWTDTQGASGKTYVVQTTEKAIQRCMLMTTDPGDLVLDPTCGSGTTAFVAEQWGRRWITIDTSRVALAIARQRLLTAKFPYYWLDEEAQALKLAESKTGKEKVEIKVKENPKPSLNKGFLYRKVPHITIGSLANDLPAEEETLYDQPYEDTKRIRVSGPFTVEGVIPLESSLDVEEIEGTEAWDDLDTFAQTEQSLAAHNARSFHEQMLDYLRKDGVGFPNNKRKKFLNLEVVQGGTWIDFEGEWQPVGETSEEVRRVAVCLGPQFGPVTAYQVENALHAASRQGYEDVVFAGFSFNAEAQALIDEDTNPRVRSHTAHIRPDVHMGDQLKNTGTGQLFTVFGAPRASVETQKDGQFIVTMEGVDIYDPIANSNLPTSADKVAAWFLDTDYDGRTFCITQAFFPDAKAWEKLKKALKTQVESDAFNALNGKVSLPFTAGKHQRAAVKVIDPRGNEVMKILKLS
jgi:adenine-specific DNA-methyltransferase